MDPTCSWRKVEDRDKQGLTIPVMTQKPEHGLHGFVLHNECWGLLNRAMSPRSVSLERLLRICKSLPFPLRFDGVSWGHEYGGLAFYDDEHYYPWEDRFKVDEAFLKIHTEVESDPMKVSWPSPLAQPQSHGSSSVLSHQTRDCFSCFPWEILELIAINLPTGDALRLRLASRSFLPIFDSQIFWASRFHPAAERGFMFEAHEQSEIPDWRGLWRATVNPADCGIRNRRRIWSIIQVVGRLLDLRLCPTHQSQQPDDRSLDNAAMSVAAGLWHESGTRRFYEGCKVQGYQRITIPSNLLQLAATVVNIAGATYISGIRFVGAADSEVSLGYITKRSEVRVRVSRLSGFELAMGSRGLRALRGIVNKGNRLPWLGDPTDTPITERLIEPESMSMIEAGYDV